MAKSSSPGCRTHGAAAPTLMAATSLKKSSMCLSPPSEAAAGGGGAPASRSPPRPAPLAPPCRRQGMQAALVGLRAAVCANSSSPAPAGRQAGRREGTHSCLRRPPADSRRWRQPARSHCPARPSWDFSPQQCLASRSWHPVQSAVTAETGGLGTQTTSNGQRRRGCWGDGYGYCSICPRQQPVPRVLLSATLDPRHPNFGVARCRGVAGRSTGA